MNTTDLVVALVLICMLGFAGYKTWQRLTGRTSCCGGAKERVPTKRIKNVIGTMTVQIGGMQCASCKNSVLKAINALDGVSAKVNLEKNTATVSFNRPLDAAELTQAIEKRGFEVKHIETH